MEEADRNAGGGKRFSDEASVLAGHDFEQRAFSGTVQSENADLGTEIEREPDVFEHFGVGRMHLPEALHRVDKLRHWIRVLYFGAPHYPCRHGRVLRLGRATRRSIALRQAAGSRRPAEPTGRRGSRQLRSARLWRPLRDVDGAGGPPLSIADHRSSQLRALQSSLTGGLRNLS